MVELQKIYDGYCRETMHVNSLSNPRKYTELLLNYPNKEELLEFLMEKMKKWRHNYLDFNLIKRFRPDLVFPNDIRGRHYEMTQFCLRWYKGRSTIEEW